MDGGEVHDQNEEGHASPRGGKARRRRGEAIRGSGGAEDEFKSDEEDEEDDDGELIFLEDGNEVAYLTSAYNRESIMLDARSGSHDPRRLADMLRRAGLGSSASRGPTSQQPAQPRPRSESEIGTAPATNEGRDLGEQKRSSDGLRIGSRPASDTPSPSTALHGSPPTWVRAEGKRRASNSPKLTRAISFARPTASPVVRQSAD